MLRSLDGILFTGHFYQFKVYILPRIDVSNDFLTKRSLTYLSETLETYTYIVIWLIIIACCKYGRIFTDFLNFKAIYWIRQTN